MKEWPTAEWIKDAERLVEMDRQLPAVLEGRRKLTDAGEMLRHAELCGYKGMLASAVRFYEQAFAADAKAADDLGARHRYLAARFAVRAGLGRGPDVPAGEAQRERLRRLALGWLRADLALWRKRIEGKQTSGRLQAWHTLNHWSTHDDLLGVRQAKALAALPSGERAEWERLWAEVGELRKATAPGKTRCTWPVSSPD